MKKTKVALNTECRPHTSAEIDTETGKQTTLSRSEAADTRDATGAAARGVGVN